MPPADDQWVLTLGDHKTRIYSSLEPINDLWAQRLRDHMHFGTFGSSHDRVERAISEAVTTAKEVGSDSPIKIMLRSFDEAEVYQGPHWDFIEQNLQRIVQNTHTPSITHVCWSQSASLSAKRSTSQDGRKSPIL